MSGARKKPSGPGAVRDPAGTSRPKPATASARKVAATLAKEAIPVTIRASRSAIGQLSVEPAKVEALLSGYGEALAESRRNGRAVSFRVEVDPSGGATVTPIESAATTPVPAAAGGAGALDAALEEARARGRVRAAQILAAHDMLSADQFAAVLGTSRMTVNTKRRSHQVLGLDGAKRGFRFPAWQIDGDGKPFAALPRLFERLGGGAWSVYRFLVQAHPELDGLTGREALNRGRSEQALAVANGIAQGTFG